MNKVMDKVMDNIMVNCNNIVVNSVVNGKKNNISRFFPVGLLTLVILASPISVNAQSTNYQNENIVGTFKIDIEPTEVYETPVLSTKLPVITSVVEKRDLLDFVDVPAIPGAKPSLPWCVSKDYHPSPAYLWIKYEYQNKESKKLQVVNNLKMFDPVTGKTYGSTYFDRPLDGFESVSEYTTISVNYPSLVTSLSLSDIAKEAENLVVEVVLTIMRPDSVAKYSTDQQVIIRSKPFNLRKNLEEIVYRSRMSAKPFECPNENNDFKPEKALPPMDPRLIPVKIDEGIFNNKSSEDAPVKALPANDFKPDKALPAMDPRLVPAKIDKGIFNNKSSKDAPVKALPANNFKPKKALPGPGLIPIKPENNDSNLPNKGRNVSNKNRLNIIQNLPPQLFNRNQSPNQLQHFRPKRNQK